MMKIEAEVHTQFKKQTLIFGIIVSIISLIICLLGIWLVYLKASGRTHFNLFGQSFNSDNVGIAAIFIGAVALIFSLRRTFKSLDAITRSHETLVRKILHSEDFDKKS